MQLPFLTETSLMPSKDLAQTVVTLNRTALSGSEALSEFTIDLDQEPDLTPSILGDTGQVVSVTNDHNRPVFQQHPAHFETSFGALPLGVPQGAEASEVPQASVPVQPALSVAEETAPVRHESDPTFPGAKPGMTDGKAPSVSATAVAVSDLNFKAPEVHLGPTKTVVSAPDGQVPKQDTEAGLPSATMPSEKADVTVKGQGPSLSEHAPMGQDHGKTTSRDGVEFSMQKPSPDIARLAATAIQAVAQKPSGDTKLHPDPEPDQPTVRSMPAKESEVLSALKPTATSPDARQAHAVNGDEIQRTDTKTADPVAPAASVRPETTNSRNTPVLVATAVPQIVAIDVNDPMGKGDPELGLDPMMPLDGSQTEGTRRAETGSHVPLHLKADVQQRVIMQLAQTPLKPDQPVELRLDPAELGQVRMVLSSQDQSLTLVLSAERPETLDLMRRHIDQLAQEFHEMGYTDLNFSFSQDQTAQDQQTPHQNAPSDLPTYDASEPQPRIVTLGGSSGLDIRL